MIRSMPHKHSNGDRQYPITKLTNLIEQYNNVLNGKDRKAVRRLDITIHHTHTNTHI